MTLFPTTSQNGPPTTTLSGGVSITVSESVSGEAWFGACGDSSLQGTTWLHIVAVNGSPVSTLFGVNDVYAVAGAFQAFTGGPTPAPTPTPTPTQVAPTVQGIDVSYHNGSINWQQVAGSGKSFVYIKSTEGTQYVDPNFNSYLAGATAAGLRVGVYHYAQPGSAPGLAAEQADHFVDVSNFQSGNLVPILDIEITNGLSSGALQSFTRQFLDRVYERTGIRAGVYTSPNFWRSNLSDTTSIPLAGYSTLWVAHWTSASAPSMPAGNWGGYGWTVWQYSDKGTVPGISKPTDLDRLSSNDFSRLLIP